MPALINLVDEKFGKLTVKSRAGTNKHGQLYWRCECTCGRQTVVLGYNLRTGNSKSCGCDLIIKPSHKLTRTRTYKLWTYMVNRATNSNDPKWKHYGGRGIGVSDEWKVFTNFLKDMGEAPKGFSLERKDNEKGYSKENCCWIPVTEQAKNRRTSIKLEIDGEVLCLAEACRKYDLNYGTVLYRLRRLKWEPTKAIGRMARFYLDRAILQAELGEARLA